MRTVSPADIRLGVTAGDQGQTRHIASTLRRATPEETLGAISSRLQSITIPSNEAYYSSPLRGRRKSTEMLTPRSSWGCSSHAQVACHLARACNIPAILVKSLDLGWISSARVDAKMASGHVFVEVLLDGRPVLWDPQAIGGRLHKDYNSETTVIEGKRIYDKGDPDELTLSHHGPEWEAETARLFPPAASD